MARPLALLSEGCGASADAEQICFLCRCIRPSVSRLQENLGGAFAAAAESTALHGTASMTGGIAAVISSVVISMLIVAGVTAGAL